MSDADGGEIIYYDTALKDEQTEQVYRCLEQMILEEIRTTDAEQARKSVYSIEKEQLNAHKEQILRVYQDHDSNLEEFGRFCQSHGGEVALLTGASGSGKSTLLKRFFYEHDRTAGAFADVVLPCAGISHALWVVICQLEEAGCFSRASDSAQGKIAGRASKEAAHTDRQPDAQNCVRWFEEKLGMLTTKESITILLDSVEQIRDWKHVRGSLFDISVPKNVTIVVSCISTDSLRAYDAQKQLNVYTLQSPDTQDAMRILDRALALSGRRLTRAQEIQIRSTLPETVMPLYMQLLAARCRQIRSRSEEEGLPFSLPAGEREGLAGFLSELGREYPILARRTLGDIAVSENGLTEQEPTRPLTRTLGLLSRLMHFMPRMSLYLDQAELSAQSVEHVPVIRLGNSFWILNRIDHTVHVCDAEGRYLCHESFGFPVAAYDICGDWIYALSEDLSETAQRRLQWL